MTQWLDNYADHNRRANVIRLVIRLAVRSNELPSLFFVHGVQISTSRDPWASGGFADIFRGILANEEVAVKRLRVTERDRTRRQEIHRVRTIIAYDVL